MEDSMRQAKSGDKVRIHYTGVLEDGTIVDSTEGREPFEFVVGEGKTVPGLELGVVGMAAGDKRELTLHPQDGWGHRRKEAEMRIKRKDFPEHIEPEVGKQLMMPDKDGEMCRVMVKSIDDNYVVLDTNHPLAGLTVKFTIEMIEVG
jgi:peptidylprolyl isomerase